MNLSIRLATIDDLDLIWSILTQAVKRMAAAGSSQWKDGYPTIDIVKNDLANNNGYLILADGEIAAYVAMIKGIEPAYTDIRHGDWLLPLANYIVVHRLAIADDFLKKGISRYIFAQASDLARKANCDSIRIDTNFDNEAMLYLAKSLGYIYCGKIYYRGSAERLAFELPLTPLT